MFKDRRVLVTGGAGFVGTNLILELKARGAKVVGTYHNRKPQIEGVEFLQADLTKKEDCKKVMEGIEYLFMTAAYVPGAQGVENGAMAFVTDPTIMNLNILEAASNAGVKKVCFISSSNGYPYSEKAVSEDEYLDGEPYEKYYFIGWHKRFTEIVCKMYAEKMKKMQVVVVKLDNIYGPYDNFKKASSHVMASLIRKAVERQNPFEIWGDGKEYKDFIFIEDAVQGIVLAMEKSKEDFDIYNIASGKNVTLNEVLQIILKEANYAEAEVVHNLDKPSTIPKRLVSIEKASEELGFTPQNTLNEGIRKTIEWYKENPCNE